MKKYNRNIILILNFITLFLTTIVYAQKSDKFDELISKIRNEIYENPDKVISVGNYIIANSGNSVDLKIKGYKLVSDGYSSKRNYQKSLENLLKAIEILPQSNNGLLKLSIETKAGIQYHQLKIYDKSIQYLDNAEEMCLQYKNKDSATVFLGINYIVRGFIYKEKLNCDIAISFFNKGISELKKPKNLLENANVISIAKYNIGNCYLLLGNNELAISNFENSYYYAKLINAKSLQAFAQKGLAQINTIQGNYENGISLLNIAYQTASDVNDLVLNQEIFKGLSENYLAINNWEKYQEYHLKFLNTQSKVKESERKSISNLLVDKENAIKSKIEAKFSNIWIVLLLITSLILVIIVFVIIKRLNHKIAIKKAKIEQLQLENNPLI